MTGEAPRILVFGQSGQVATALLARAIAQGARVLVLGRGDLDLSKAPATGGLEHVSEKTAKRIEAFQPTFAINASAYTAVDRAETERDQAFALNEGGAAYAARLATELGVDFAHLSTDYVYAGTKSEPYVETDPVDPQSIYGASKRAGEQAVLAAHNNAFIFRTAWVYSPFGNNFVKTMLRFGAEREGLSVVDDQLGSPTSAHDIAEALVTLAAQDRAGRGGVYHLAGTGEASWCDFARAIFAISGSLGGPQVPVEAIPTSAYPTPAKRPANSRLDCSKLQSELGLYVPKWEDSLERVIKAFLVA